MRSEMDLLNMNEAERICWLKANRVTLIVVGTVWIGMIVERLLQGDLPWFLIVMVPVFAGLRLSVYRYCKRTLNGLSR